MLGALRRIASVFSDGRYDEHTFPWEVLVDEDLADHVWSTVGQQYSRNTAVKDASALRLMLKACYQVGLLTHDEYALARSFDARGVGKPRPPAGHYLSSADIAKLVEACASGRGNTVTRVRDTALVLTLASTAARGVEVTGARLEHLYPEHRRVWLQRTKSNKPRDAWLHPSAVVALRHWVDERGDRPGPLFVPLSRTRPLVHRGEMSTLQVWKILRDRSLEAGLPHTTPHDLRRFVVSSLLDHTDLAMVARIVGHTNPATTALYDRRPGIAQAAAVASLSLPTIPAP
ncbi:site-specific integrase [Nocardioides KLBMP 9356]|uniref:Site-specific integrase n=1 Tax=Nocardioides potassii TaxID=2911371 RepID=A0ABS9HCU9_9ACTN|nr:site-specific integrase [Nocardioides potassii]MCF6378121.1 site-specific integrase [Nocardioides potassii]